MENKIERIGIVVLVILAIFWYYMSIGSKKIPIGTGKVISIEESSSTLKKSEVQMESNKELHEIYLQNPKIGDDFACEEKIYPIFFSRKEYHCILIKK